MIQLNPFHKKRKRFALQRENLKKQMDHKRIRKDLWEEETYKGVSF